MHCVKTLVKIPSISTEIHMVGPGSLGGRGGGLGGKHRRCLLNKPKQLLLLRRNRFSLQHSQQTGQNIYKQTRKSNIQTILKKIKPTNKLGKLKKPTTKNPLKQPIETNRFLFQSYHKSSNQIYVHACNN